MQLIYFRVFLYTEEQNLTSEIEVSDYGIRWEWGWGMRVRVGRWYCTGSGSKGGGVGGWQEQAVRTRSKKQPQDRKKTKTHESPVFIDRSVKRCIRWKIKKNSAHKFKSGQGGSWKENLSQQVEGGGDFFVTSFGLAQGEFRGREWSVAEPVGESCYHRRRRRRRRTRPSMTTTA